MLPKKDPTYLSIAFLHIRSMVLMVSSIRLLYDMVAAVVLPVTSLVVRVGMWWGFLVTKSILLTK
jgi:hypothetical protein